MPKYEQKRIVDAYVSGGRRHVYLGLEAPSAAENGGSAKNRVTHTVTVIPFFFVLAKTEKILDKRHERFVLQTDWSKKIKDPN